MEPQTQHIWTIIAIMLGAGIFGGIVNFFALPEQVPNGTPPDKDVLRPILRGLAAAFIVPLFLQTISSDLISSGDATFFGYLVFTALCLVAAISSRAFITSVSQRVLRELEQTKEQAAAAEEKADRASTRTEELKQETVETRQQMRKDLKTLATSNIISMGRPFPPVMSGKKGRGAAPEVTGGAAGGVGAGGIGSSSQKTMRFDFDATYNSDPNKGKFGGRSERDGWKLTAKVDRHNGSAIIFDVQLIVEVDEGVAIQDDTVTFHLHPTFGDPVERVPLVDRIARLSLLSLGAFTVGVTANDGDVELELDLADPALVDAPQEFRER